MLTSRKNPLIVIFMKIRFLSYIVLFLALAKPVYSSDDMTLWTQATDHIKEIWDNGRLELALPVYTWHNRWCYDRDKIKDYNENPWGIGIGKYIEPTPDRRYGLLAMKLQDSFNKPELSTWYSWQKLWRPGQDFRPSLGFVAGITFRDNYNWLPIPGAAPTIGFDYKSFSVEALYIPGFDVLFTWLSWRF